LLGPLGTMVLFALAGRIERLATKTISV